MTTDFTADSVSYPSYLWDFDDGSFDSTSGYTVNHTFSSPGTYSVKLTVTGSTDSVYVYVWPAPDYGKVLLTTSDGGESGQEATITAIYPTADVTYNGYMSFDASVTYAKENGIGIICRPTTGLSDSRIAGAGAIAETWNIISIHAHGSNDLEELTNPSYIGGIWAVRNATGSYGAGVEFTIPDVVNESTATAAMAGYVAKFMDTYVTTISDLRTLFRTTASNAGVHLDADGYGTVDWSAVESGL